MISDPPILADDHFAAQQRVAELRQMAENVKRIKALKQAFGLDFYRPHAKQDKFHAAAEVTGRYCRTGNRGGKTKCGAAEDVAFCLGYRPWYRHKFDVKDGKGNVVRVHDPENDEYSRSLITLGIPQRPIKLLLIVTDWDKSNEIFTNNVGGFENFGEYFQLIPTTSIAGTPHKSRGGHIDRIDIKRPTEYGGGISSIYIDTVESYKHAKMSAESSDWDVIHLDEPCPQQMFTAHKRGLVDRNGKFWVNCTPLTEMWINDEFTPAKMNMVKEAPDGMEFTKVDSKVGRRFIITWSIRDNPYNSPDAIAEFEAGLTREEKACRLEGLPLAMAGLVYKEFVPDLHTLLDVPKGWEDFHKPPKSYTIRVWWDDHIVLPQALLYVATAPNGTIYVYDEHYFSNSIDENATLLVEKTDGYFVATQEIDPDALIEHPVSECSVVDTLATYGLFFTPASKDRSLGINLTKKKLAERGHDKFPTIYFSPHLTQTLYEFSHWVINLDTQKPIDKHDHQMSNLYRAILAGLDYIQPPDDAPVDELPHRVTHDEIHRSRYTFANGR